MRVAVIGAGLQAARRVPAILKRGDELMVIVAAHEESARRVADAYGCEYAAGWEDVVERKDIDAVLVCTPPNMHRSISMAAMRSGKHVLCEKPLALDSKEAQEMIALAVRNTVVLKCGFNHRYHPSLREIKRLITNDELGEIYYLTASYGIEARSGYANEWKANPKFVSGGELMDHGIHLLDLSRWFMGDFSEIFAVTRNYHIKGMPFEDNAFVTLKTKEGKVAFIQVSLTQWINKFMLEVVGSEGYARSSGLGGSYGTEVLTVGRRAAGKPFSYLSTEFRGDDKCWEEEWKDFADCTEKPTNVSSAVDGLVSLKLVESAYESARTGSIVMLDAI